MSGFVGLKIIRMSKPRNNFEKWGYNLLKKRKVLFGYETESIPYTINGEYKPDFVLSNGVFIELKGKFDEAARRKMAAVKKCNPHLDIRFVFYKASAKIKKGAKMTHGDWAKKYGFPFADHDIPSSWCK